MLAEGSPVGQILLAVAVVRERNHFAQGPLVVAVVRERNQVGQGPLVVVVVRERNQPPPSTTSKFNKIISFCG